MKKVIILSTAAVALVGTLIAIAAVRRMNFELDDINLGGMPEEI